MKFNANETNALLEAIKYYRGREGNFYSSDPIFDVIGKLSNNEENEFNNSELKNIMIVVNENIIFLKNYSYPKGLSDDQSKTNKERILVPLEEIKTKINKVL